MALEFERKCVQVGGSKSVIIPTEILEALSLNVGDSVMIRYYEKPDKTKTDNTRRYVSFWKKGT